MLTAAAYTRRSGDLELQRKTSTEDQERLCRDAAGRFECIVDRVYSDEEFSGATGRRPAYQQMMRDAKAGLFQAIVVESQDRLWRDQAEMHAALRRLRFWSVRVFSVATGTDLTDRTGGVLATIYGLKDEVFLEDLRDKVRRGMLGQVRRGLSVGSRAHGYRSEPVRDEAGRIVGYRRIKDPAEAGVIVRIFRLRRQGLTPRAIAHRLNAERVPPPRTARGRRSGSWTPSTISGSAKKAIGILHNPLYVGRVVWNRSRKVRDPDTGKRVMRMRPESEWVWVEVPDLRIVPKRLWDDVQSLIAHRRRTPEAATHGARPKHLLSGILECGECGSHYIIQVKKKRGQYYGCAAHVDRGKTVCANGKLVRRDVIEQKILAHVFGDLFAPHRLAYLSQAVDEAIARFLEDRKAQSPQREAALAEARRELANIAEAIRQGIITPTTKAMLEDAERRVAALEAAAEAERRPPKVAPLASSVERYLRDLRETLGRNADLARQILARGLDRVVLRRDGKNLVAEVRGNLAGVLRLEEEGFGSGGAGRGI